MRLSIKLGFGVAASAMLLGALAVAVRRGTRGEPEGGSRPGVSSRKEPPRLEQLSAPARPPGPVAEEPGAVLRAAEPAGDLERGLREAVEATSHVLVVRLVAPCRLRQAVQVELTDDDGARRSGKGTESVTWAGLEGRRYTAVCASSGWMPASVEVDLRSAPPRAGAELVLTPLYTLTGVVLDRATLAPVAGAIVEARGRSAGAAGVTFERPIGPAVASEADGRFCLVQFTDLGAAETRLEASATGFAAADSGWLPFPATPRIEDLVILLERGDGTLCRVEGVVRDRDSGLPLGGALVALADVRTEPADVWRLGDSLIAPELEPESPAPAAHGSTGPIHQATTGIDGRFSIESRALGDARLVVALAGYTLHISGPVALERGAVVWADCELVRGSSVYGRIDAPSGNPGFVVARVELIGPGGTFSERVESSGEFDIGGVADGEYEFRVMVQPTDAEIEAGAYPLTVRRVVVAGKDVELHLSVGLGLEGTTIRGAVVRPPPLESGTWRIGILAGPSREGLRNSSLVEADGSFTITEAQPGPGIILAAGRSDDGSLQALDVQRLVVDADSIVQDVALDSTRTCVRGQVRSAQGVAARARVSVEAHDSPYALLFPLVLDVTADERGEFAVWGLPPGEYVFTAGPAGAQARVTIPSGFRGELSCAIEL